MLQGISHLIRLSIGKVILGYGADNLMRYLKLHIREDFLKRLKLGDLLRKNAEMASLSVKRDIGVDDVIEDLVDMFIDDNLGSKALGLLVGHARERGMSPEDSRVVVHGGSMGPELVKEMEGLQNEFGKILYDFLNKSFKNLALKWIAEKKKEDPEESLGEHGEKETEEGEREGEPENVGIGVKDERELEEEMVAENRKMVGLIEGANAMLDREIGNDKKRVIYKAILNDRIIGGKTLEVLVREMGVGRGTLFDYEKDLRVRLEKYTRGLGLGPKFDLGKKEVVVPDYRVLLKDNKELQVELKSWLKDEGHEEGEGRGKERGGKTLEVLDLFAEGKDPSAVAEGVGISRDIAQKVKTRYFNKAYEGWYMDKVEQVRKAGYREVVRVVHAKSKAIPDYTTVLRKDRAAQDSLKALLEKHKEKASPVAMVILKGLAEGKDLEDVGEDAGVDVSIVKGIKSKYFDEAFVKWYKEGRGGGEEEELPKGPGRVHEKLVEYVFKPTHQRVVVTIEFKSRFDSTGEMGTRGRVDPSTGETRPGDVVDPEFKWVEYRARIKERSGKNSILYTFQQKLDGKTGKFIGEPVEKLVVNGEAVGKDQALMKLIHKNMEEHVLPKDDSVRGITPMQHTFSVHYVNTYHGDHEVDWIEYHGVEDFVSKHHGLFPKDTQHERYERERRDFQQRKVLGPYEIESELTTLITQYERDLKKETDPETKKRIQDSIDKLKGMIKEKSDVDQKMIDDLIKQEMLIRHPTTVVHEKTEVTTEKPEKEPVTADLRYALVLPPVGGGGAKDFLAIAKRYGGRNLDRWFDPAQIVQLAGLVNREINRLKVVHLKDPDRVRRFDTEKEQFQKLLPEFIHDLRVRRDNFMKASPVDYAALEKNRNVKWVDDPGAIDKVLEDVKKEITGGPATAAVIGGPKSDDAQKLVSLFHSYGLTHQPNPRDWLAAGDILVLAKAFNRAVSAKMDKELGAKKPKGMSEDDWKDHINGIRMDYAKDLRAVEELLPEFVKDLKIRRDEFAKDHPLDYKALAGRRDVLWVDDAAKVKSTIEEAIKELRESLKPAEKKQPGVKIIEIGKFEALAGFLRSQLKGFLTLGGRFKRLGLNPVWGGEGTAGLKVDQAKLKEVYEEQVKKLEGDKTLTEEEKKALNESRIQMRKVLEKIGEVIETRESIPAISGAKALQHYLAYFSSLFTLFSGMLWYRNKYSAELEEVKETLYNYLVIGAGAAGDVPADPKEDKKDTGLTKEEAREEAGQLQNEIYEETHHLSGLHLKPREAVKEGLSGLRISLKEFMEMMDVLTAKTAAEPVEPEKKPAEPPKKPSETPAFDEAYKKYVIPENLLHHSQSIIEKMKDHANSKVKAMAPKAEKEFKDLTENLVKTFKEGFTDEDIERMAEKKKISPEKAAVQLRKHRDALTIAAMDEFLIAWSDILTHAEEKMPLTKKDKSPLGNKPSSEYERMGQFVEDHLPELFAIAPPQDEKELPEPGVPTPKKLREEIERIWSTEKELSHEDLIKEYRASLEEHMGGGGGGNKRKVRQKAVKTPPPSGVWQQIMQSIATRVKALMVKTPQEAKTGMEHLVVEVLMRQILAVKKELAKMKADEHIPVDDVIDGLVFLVKQIFNHMLNLKVAPSVSQMQKPPPGAPDFTGTPDVPIDNLKEAMKFFDTFKGLVDVINEYLKPHPINIPKLKYVDPVRGPRRDERYLPNGLAETIQFYENKEKGIQRPPKKDYEPMPHVPGDAEKKLREQKPGTPSFTGRPHEDYGDYRKSELLDYPTQMSSNIAAKFIGVEMPKEEFDAVMS